MKNTSSIVTTLLWQARLYDIPKHPYFLSSLQATTSTRGLDLAAGAECFNVSIVPVQKPVCKPPCADRFDHFLLMELSARSTSVAFSFLEFLPTLLLKHV